MSSSQAQMVPATYIASVVVRFNQSAGARTYVRVTD